VEELRKPRWKRGGQRRGILEVVIRGLSLKATDPRDKIFAMLQFGNETSDLTSLPDIIRPDYRKKETTTTVFCDFVRWWIQNQKSLAILSAVHTLRNRSWQQMYYGEPQYGDLSALPIPSCGA
jgi:hypothetical protein